MLGVISMRMSITPGYSLGNHGLYFYNGTCKFGSVGRLGDGMYHYFAQARGTNLGRQIHRMALSVAFSAGSGTNISRHGWTRAYGQEPDSCVDMSCSVVVALIHFHLLFILVLRGVLVILVSASLQALASSRLARF